MPVLVDTNVIIDVLTDDPHWADWSQAAMEEQEKEGLAVNPAIFAELCYGCETLGEAQSIVRELGFTYLETPRKGLFVAAQAFGAYRKAGGKKDFVLPDFFIGGHAEAESLRLITRDQNRYQTYFPGVELITPGGRQ